MQIDTSAVAVILAFVVFSAYAEEAYTNHAGNVVSGVVVALDARTTTISNAMETVKLPLSIFPESEQRRIVADFVLGQGTHLRQGYGGQGLRMGGKHHERQNDCHC